jgi:hypothetical protein
MKSQGRMVINDSEITCLGRYRIDPCPGSVGLLSDSHHGGPSLILRQFMYASGSGTSVPPLVLFHKYSHLFILVSSKLFSIVLVTVNVVK